MKPEIKKLLILNLPYLLFVWLFDKVGAAVRLSPGADASAKLLHLGDGFTTAFSSIAPSFHPADLLIGIAGAVIVRLIIYVKGKTGNLGDKCVNGGFQLAFPTCTRLFCLVLRIALSLAALAGDDNGQAIFPAQLVAHVPYAVIAPFVGIVFMVVYKVHRAKNDMVMDVSFVNVRREYILMLPLCYRVGKLLSDFMGFLIIDFPRLKGLYQMKG